MAKARLLPAKPGIKLVVVGQALHGLGHGRRLGIAQQRCLTVLEVQPEDAARQDAGQAAGHGLHDHLRKAFRARTDHEGIMFAIEGRQIGIVDKAGIAPVADRAGLEGAGKGRRDVGVRAWPEYPWRLPGCRSPSPGCGDRRTGNAGNDRVSLSDGGWKWLWSTPRKHTFTLSLSRIMLATRRRSRSDMTMMRLET